ncbi:MAG TPA: signal peptidase I [Acidilobales archaeon]|nr:signal peptidase I [Acidilobales archaeon]
MKERVRLQEIIKDIPLLVSLAILITFLALNFSGYLMLAVIEGKSMEPLLKYGDLVLVTRVSPQDIHVNDVIVYKSCRPGNMIIHRVINVVVRDGKYYFVTQGDNNPFPDSALPGNEFREGYPCTLKNAPGVPSERVIGKVIEINGNPIKIPYVGLITILFKSFLKILGR